MGVSGLMAMFLKSNPDSLTVSFEDFAHLLATKFKKLVFYLFVVQGTLLICLS